MIKEKAPAFEVCLYVGSKERYNGPSFDLQYLKRLIQTFQDNDNHPVRVMPCTYFRTTEYSEDGWEISAISYANSKYTPEEIKTFMGNLCGYLLVKLNQNRITMTVNAFGEYAHLAEHVTFAQDDAIQLDKVMEKKNYASRQK